MALARSDEVLGVVRRWTRAFQVGDLDTMANLLLQTADLVSIGVDADEWWIGFASSREVGRTQMSELPAREIEELEAHAFANGDTGWLVGRWVAEFANDTRFEYRMTFVLVVERGQWRIAHMHTSIPVPNEAVLGFELTTSLDTVAAVVATEQPDVSGDASLDGLVTVLFSDIEASTQLAERLGDVAWLGLLARYDRSVRTAVDRRRGRVVKAMGDGYMAVFGSARDGLSCALDLTEIALDGLSTRVGVHLGEVVRSADDFFGRTVTIAARIAGSATGGEVLTSDIVRQVVAGFRDVAFGDVRSIELKGVEGLHLVHAVRRA